MEELREAERRAWAERVHAVDRDLHRLRVAAIADKQRRRKPGVREALEALAGHRPPKRPLHGARPG